MEVDIERILIDEGPCRPCEIREKLKQKPECKSYDARVLNVFIQRGLVKLGDGVYREYRGRQRIFCSIRKEHEQKVENELYKHDMISDISKEDLQQQRF